MMLWARLLAVAALVQLLAGCALPRMIDSEVQSYPGTAPAVTGASYRFERLPSQQNSVQQEHLEALATQALAHAGLTHADAAAHARYLVQISVLIETFTPPTPRPVRRYGMFGGWGMGWDSPSLAYVMEPPWYRHTLHLLLREASSGQVAYETQASFEGPWSDSEHLLPAILEAALRDYPTPPSGPRKVVVELAPDGTLK